MKEKGAAMNEKKKRHRSSENPTKATEETTAGDEKRDRAGSTAKENSAEIASPGGEGSGKRRKKSENKAPSDLVISDLHAQPTPILSPGKERKNSGATSSPSGERKHKRKDKKDGAETILL